MSAGLIEQLHWHSATSTPPDADLTVLAWVQYEDGTADWCSAWLDADGWHDCASGGLIAGTVTRWAQPEGPKA